MRIVLHQYQLNKTRSKMKKIIILSSCVLLVANLLLGAIISYYGGYNLAVSSVVIVATGLLLYLTDTIHLKDGYKISMLFLFTFVGVLEFIFSLVAPNRFTDNWWLVLVIGLIAIEVILLVITNSVSKKN